MDWAHMRSNNGLYKSGGRTVKGSVLDYDLANLNDVSKKGFSYIAGVITKYVDAL